MIKPRLLVILRIACLCLGTLLMLANLEAITWAGAPTTAEPTASLADLEDLVRQFEDPQQRERLLHTLRTLLTVARQNQTGAPLPEKPDPLAMPSQGIFFAFGELTQHLASIGRRAGQAMATLPMLLAELPTRLSEPTLYWQMLNTGICTAILMTLGIIFHLVANRLQARLRASLLVSEPLPCWRKISQALITVGLAVAPYIALLTISGILFSILPVGATMAGLAALVISTALLYRLARAVALVLLDPEWPSARLLPIADSTAQWIWSLAQRLITLAAVYFLITRSLLTIGVSEEIYLVLRGLMIIMIAGVLSGLIIHLSRKPRADIAAPTSGRQPLGAAVMATLQRVWPIIALAYIWSAALLALFSFKREVTFLVTAALQMGVVIGVGITLLWLGDLLFARGARLNDQLARYLPGLERRTLRYLSAAWWSVRVLIIVTMLLSIGEIWGLGLAWFLVSPLGGELLSRLIMLVVTVAIVMFVVDLSTFISEKLVASTPDGLDTSKKRKTLIPLVATAIKYGTLFAGGLIVLHHLGINVTPILAGVGILSLAVGFGAQTLVKDIINGLFILVEDSLAVGDVVNIRGTGGVVEAVNLRTLRLRDLQGSVHTIPNSQVDIITNLTKDYAYYLLDVNVAYREDPDEVSAALRDIDAEMRADPTFAADMLTPIDILGVDRFADSAVVIRARLKTKPIKQWSVGREFNRRMKKLFDVRGIEIPFPHRKIYWGQSEQRQAEPTPLSSHNVPALMTTSEPAEGALDRDRRGNVEAS